MTTTHKYKTPEAQRRANKRWYNNNKEYFKKYYHDHAEAMKDSSKRWQNKNRKKYLSMLRRKAKIRYWLKKLQQLGYKLSI